MDFLKKIKGQKRQLRNISIVLAKEISMVSHFTLSQHNIQYNVCCLILQKLLCLLAFAATVYVLLLCLCNLGSGGGGGVVCGDEFSFFTQCPLSPRPCLPSQASTSARQKAATPSNTWPTASWWRRWSATNERRRRHPPSKRPLVSSHSCALL